MPIRLPVLTRTRLAIGLAALAVTAAACGILDVKDPGDMARVRISGTKADGPLKLIMSNNFIQVVNAQTNELTVALLGADTVQLSDLPYQNDYELEGRLRFFLRLINPDTSAVDVRIQVEIDGVKPYDRQTMLRASQTEYTYTAF